jgi:plastocyanin
LGALGTLPDTQTVHVFNFDFSTNPIGMPIMDATVNLGDTVRWQWDSGVHSVTSVAGSAEQFDSGNMSAPGPTFQWTFTHAGVFNYFCDLHGFDNGDGTAGGMSGTITVLQQAVSSSWNVDADGSWQTASNWTNNAIPSAAGDSATFGSAISGAHTITVDALTSVGTLTFDAGGLRTYTIGGTSVLTLAGADGADARVNVVNGSHTIDAPLALANNATFDIASSQSTLTVTNLQPASSAIGKTGDGTLLVNNIRTTASLSVTAGTLAVATNGSSVGASRVGTLALSSSATVDLRDNDLIVQNSSYAQVSALVAGARNGGNWNAPGLTSSAAATALPRNKTLGVLTGEQLLSVGANTFDGFDVVTTDTLVKFTYYGDTDFNGIINFDDYSRTDAGFNGGGADWFHGDFDYNGLVNFDDYSLIDLAFNSQSGTLIRAVEFLDGSNPTAAGMNDPALRKVMDHFAQFGEPYAQAFLSAVPEPSLLLAGVPALIATFARRRRRHHRQ